MIIGGLGKGEKGRTIYHDKHVDTQYGETLTDAVICVLEFALHDRGVDFDEDYAA
jgi:hypothetical protein